VLVRSAATFAEVLEAELNCAYRPSAPGAWNRPLTAPLFVFARPAIPLSPVERRALVALNDLGADLGDSPSFGALRRAFKRLARRYHPDRHPGASPAEQAHLARLFVDVTEHYRVLVAVIKGPAKAGHYGTPG